MSISFIVAELLRDARRRSGIPETRIYNFSIFNYSETIAPVTPLLRYDKKNIEVAGSALFSGDKMVGEIDTDQTMLLNTLMGTTEAFEYIYEGQTSKENGEAVTRGAAVSIRNPKKKIRIDTSGEAPVIDIELKFKAFLDEYAGDYNLSVAENEESLEEAIAQSIQADTLKLLEHFQNLEADPVGFGEMVRAKKNEYWKSIKWKEEVYKEVIFNVDVRMNLQSYGTFK